MLHEIIPQRATPLQNSLHENRCGLTLFLAVYYLGDAISEHRRLVRDIAYELFEPQDADAAALGLYSFIERRVDVLSPDASTNSIICAVDRALRIREHHRYIRLAPSDALRGFLLMRDGLTDVPMADMRLSRTNEYLYSRIMRAFIPALAGHSIDTQLRDPHSRFLTELRSGNTFGLREKINALASGQWLQEQRNRAS